MAAEMLSQKSDSQTQRGDRGLNSSLVFLLVLIRLAGVDVPPLPIDTRAFESLVERHLVPP